jgi:DNA-binding PadR family transcriptional regulator
LQEIASKTEGVWRPGAGSIYPILKELMQGGYIKAASQRKAGKTQHIYQITSEGRKLLQRSSETFLRTGKNWGAMRAIIMELVDPKNIPAMFTHMSTGQFTFLRGILESKKDAIPRRELKFMLKEYTINLEKQLDWTKRIAKNL